MNTYKSSAELKAMAKEQLFDKYGMAIGTVLLILLISIGLMWIPVVTIPRNTVFGYILYLLCSFILSTFLGILYSGESYFYLKLICKQPASVVDIFYGFRSHADKALIIQMILAATAYISMIPANIFETLYLLNNNAIWMVFMSVAFISAQTIIIIVHLNISQAYYLLQDFPDYSAKEILKMSRQMMKGHKGRLFYIELSFIPLFLLGILSCCIAFLWIIPYMKATKANFYMDLIKNRKQVEQQL